MLGAARIEGIREPPAMRLREIGQVPRNSEDELQDVRDVHISQMSQSAISVNSIIALDDSHIRGDQSIDQSVRRGDKSDRRIVSARGARPDPIEMGAFNLKKEPTFCHLFCYVYFVSFCVFEFGSFFVF